MPPIRNILSAIREAERQGLTVEAGGTLTGYSGTQLTALLQRLTRAFRDEDTCYLEVGVFQGLTLLSVSLANSNTPCYGIDNFEFFDPEDKNYNIVQERAQKLGIENYSIINKDYEEAFSDLEAYLEGQQIGVYFVDGPHDYRSQLMCLQLARPYLHPNAVIVVDDSNYRHVRQANRDFLTVYPEFKLLFEAYTPAHPKNLSEEKRGEVQKGWWNGVNVLIRDADNEMPRHYPPTPEDRSLYLNEHHIHAAKYAGLAPQLLNTLADISNARIPRALKRIGGILSDVMKGNFRGRYSAMNTYSDDLPESHLVEPID